MNATHIFSWLLPVTIGLLDAEVEILRHSKTLICESISTEFVYYETNLSHALDSVLNRYLSSSSKSRTVITDIIRYHATVSYESCSLLFLDHIPEMDVFILRSTNRKLIVTSTASYDHISELFIQHKLYDAVFFVFDQSQLAIRYYNRFRKLHYEWETLEYNPLIEATRDLVGSPIDVKGYTRMDLVFIDFLVVNMNATSNASRVTNIGMAFTHSIYEYGGFFHQIYMHQTTGLQILVPKLDEPKPMISVLVDPFDFDTWLMCGAVILATAFLRMCYSRRCTVWQYLRSVQDIVACSIVSTPLSYHRLLERFNIGLLNLLNVVVITAYKSLVISFLLNTRYYPELDTFQQVNESCCWDSSAIARTLELHVSNSCLSRYSNYSFNPTRRHNGRFLCYFIDRYIELSYKEDLSQRIAENYRRSRLVIQPYPVMAVSYGDVGVIEWIHFYAGVFFAEGALFKFFDIRDEKFSAHRSNQEKPIAVRDLSLMWIAYCCGVCLSWIVFIGEFGFYYFEKRVLGFPTNRKRILFRLMRKSTS
uniref:ionotropic receptor 116 precursor n=1 Tax=Aedes aegypti TaxID=7159 RepID=UPI000C284F25|nr:ionotropic receptor 116 precursor [Aedes aegypti]